MWSPRIASSNAGANQFGESVVAFFEYADTSNSLTIGMPVYLDVLDRMPNIITFFQTPLLPVV